MAYSKTLEFGGSHFQTKSAKFPWDPGSKSREGPWPGSLWSDTSQSGCNLRNWSPAERPPPGYLRPQKNILESCANGINWIMLWKLLLFVLGSPEGRPSRLQTLTMTKTKTLKSARDAVTSDERKHKWKHMKCIAWTKPQGEAVTM